MSARRLPLAAAVAAAGLLAGCAGTGFDAETGLYARPVGGAPATVNTTPYSPALQCLAAAAAARGIAPPRVAVGEIADLTGRADLQTGRVVSQGAALFAVTALTRAGLPTVERLDRTVSEIERAYATNHLLSDTPEQAGQSGDNFRPIYAGEIAGSRYYVVGGVTELNYNLRSRGADLAVGAVETPGAKAALTGSDYVMNVAIDLRLIDTISQEVVATAAYQKQIVGREIRAGVFDFLGGTLFDLTAGGSALEPVQFAVRTAVERGLYDFAADLQDVPREACLAGEATAEPSLLVRRRAQLQLASAVAAATPRSAEPPSPLAQPVAGPRPARSGAALSDPVPSAAARPQPRVVLEPGTWRLRRADSR